jgi:thioesterase domain-containing protein
VNQTVGAASTLLDTWTRILSQTEHNQRLILDPSWQGASQDMADLEAEAQAKQQAVIRREAEEQERKATAARKAEEEERKRAAQFTTQQKTSLRTRGRVTSRGTPSTARTPTSGYSTTDTSTTSIARGTYGLRRAASGIGRGTRGGRARGGV